MLDGVNFGGGFAERFLFPAPDPSYGPQSYKRHLCWIPWNEVISPHRAKDEKCTDGIPCLWFPAPKAATVILFFHANAEDLGMSFAVLKHMRDQFKVNVLSVEYPGYGLLHHMSTNEDAVYEVALTAFRFLVDEVNVRYSQIILFGRSLGSGPAVYLAAQYPVGGLILVNAISSVKAAVQSVAGRLVAWTWRERFPNHKIIANVSCSTLFIHGECDGLLPPEHSLRLFKRCRARKLLITPPKMEHNSNLFGDASFLAVPAIHFFGFPGYYTSTPPRLPAYLFENPERRARLREQMKEDSSVSQPWLCGCLAKGDPHHLDVTFCRQEHSVEDITIRFSESPVENNGNGGTASTTQPQGPAATSSRAAELNASSAASSSLAPHAVGPTEFSEMNTTSSAADTARRETAQFPSRNQQPPLSATTYTPEDDVEPASVQQATEDKAEKVEELVDLDEKEEQALEDVALGKDDIVVGKDHAGQVEAVDEQPIQDELPLQKEPAMDLGSADADSAPGETPVIENVVAQDEAPQDGLVSKEDPESKPVEEANAKSDVSDVVPSTPPHVSAPSPEPEKESQEVTAPAATADDSKLEKF
jgi:pimeloyl-ACP methyl ester carboxylesterase